MTDTQLTIIVSAIPPTLVALASLIASLRNAGKIREIQTATNGMKHELVQMTAKASRAEGKEEERVEERARQTETPALPIEVVAPVGKPLEVTQTKIKL